MSCLESVKGSPSSSLRHLFPLNKAVKRIEGLSLSDRTIGGAFCVRCIDSSSKGCTACEDFTRRYIFRFWAAYGCFVREDSVTVSINGVTISILTSRFGKVDCGGANSEESSSVEFHF